MLNSVPIQWVRGQIGVSPVFRETNKWEKEPALALMDQVLVGRQPERELLPEAREDPPEAPNPSPTTRLCVLDNFLLQLNVPAQHEGYSSYFLTL